MENIEEHIQRPSETLSSIKKDLYLLGRTDEPTTQPITTHPRKAKTVRRSSDRTTNPAVIGDVPLTTPSRDRHVVKKSKPAGTMARNPLKITCYNSN